MAPTDEPIETIRQMLDLRTLEEIKKVASHLHPIKNESRSLSLGTGASSLSSRLPTRKADLIVWIETLLKDDTFLKVYYSRLSSLEQEAVQEVVHSKDSKLDAPRFEAKYGDLPGISLSWSDYGSRGKEKSFPGLSVLMSQYGVMPRALQASFKRFVSKPREMEIASVPGLPEKIELPGEDEMVALAQHDTEHAAIQDVMAVLMLADSGKIGASAKTGKVSQAGANAIRKVLSHGDFYPEDIEAPHEYDVQMGSLGIRPFAWAMLLQAANLAQVAGNRLELTRTGTAALKKAPQEVLSTLWERWIKNKILHEMNRIEVIKGQKSAKHPLAAAEPCRSNIASALAQMEEGKWVETGDFFKFLIAKGHRFEAVRHAWVLYLVDPQYGRLESADWEHLSGRFARAFLLEYAATLGLIDVALVPPWGAVSNLDDFWGAQELSCLSRYDGLWALRLNSLGAWILGKKKAYAPSFHDEPSLNVLSNLEITMPASAGSSSDELFLDRICEKKAAAGRTWRLTLSRLLQAVEEGVDIQRVISFFEERSKGNLPPPVQEFLNDFVARVGKVKEKGEARIVECADSPLAQLIANDSRLRNLCLPLGERYIVVLKENMTSFRKALRELGYVVGGQAEQ